MIPLYCCALPHCSMPTVNKLNLQEDNLFHLSFVGSSNFSEGLWWPQVGCTLRTLAGKSGSAKISWKSAKNAHQKCKISQLIREREQGQRNWVFCRHTALISWRRGYKLTEVAGAIFLGFALWFWSKQSIFLYTTILQHKTCWSQLRQQPLSDEWLAYSAGSFALAWDLGRSVCILLLLWIIW